MKKWLNRLFGSGTVISVLLLAVLYYTFAIEPDRLVINSVSLEVPHWSNALNGFKIVAISDIHGGSDNITGEKIRKVVELANEQNPDIIVLLGDYVSQAVSNTSPLLRIPMNEIADNLSGLKAKFGVFAIIGNHDRWYNSSIVENELKRIGYNVIDNETVSFESDGKIVSIIGIEDFWKNQEVKIDDQLSKIKPLENLLVITHNPDSFDFTPESISLVMAGHTHGGQVNFPIIGTPILVAKPEYTAGHVLKDGRNLFVTTGVGTSGLGVRFRVPPEIAVITLNSIDH